MNIVTSANHDFFHCLAGLVDSVHRHYNKKPIVYDMGLTDADRKALDADFVPMPVPADTFTFASAGDSRFIRATHKPLCIRHYWQQYHEPMIFLDADCLFMARVEETGFDLGVTLRTKGLDMADPFNGVLNSGVLLWNTPSTEFLEVWARKCLEDNTTDQKAMVELLGETIDWQAYDRLYDWRGMSVKVFRTDDLNDFHLRNGKIWHMKGHRHDPAVYSALLEAMRTGQDPYAVYKRFSRLRRGGFWRKLWPFGRKG